MALAFRSVQERNEGSVRSGTFPFVVAVLKADNMQGGRAPGSLGFLWVP